MMRAALCAVIADEPDLTIAAITANSADVVQMAETLHPDLILLSLGSPGREGISALASLHKTLPLTPILALTTNEVPNQDQTALDCGAQAVLTKAAQRDELLSALRGLRTAKQRQS